MIKTTPDYDLSSRNTFRMKVKCALWVEYDSASDLAGMPFDSYPQPVMHIGGGSNLLFTGDFPGTVLHSRIGFLKFVDMGLDELLVTVGAGVKLDDFCARMCSEGLWGAENLSLIPGEVGAAAVQNVGAYGVEIKDILRGVVCFDRKTGEKTVFKVEECGYGYRDSIFKKDGNKGRYIITSVLFKMSRKYSPRLGYGALRSELESRFPNVGEGLTPMMVREAVIGIRRAKLPDPDEIGSAGSFFKNPVVPAEKYSAIVASTPDGKVPHYDLPDGTVKIPAAWMIEQCGFKGQSLGGARVYSGQPLVIVNDSGSATPQEIIALENRVKEGVKEKFDVELHPEVEHI